jgi:hypothetical protein
MPFQKPDFFRIMIKIALNFNVLNAQPFVSLLDHGLHDFSNFVQHLQ